MDRKLVIDCRLPKDRKGANEPRAVYETLSAADARQREADAAKHAKRLAEPIPKTDRELIEELAVKIAALEARAMKEDGTS